MFVCPLFTYTVILVSCHSRENGLAKDEGFVGFLFEQRNGRIGQVLALLPAPKNQMYARLVLVHRVQNDLRLWFRFGFRFR